MPSNRTALPPVPPAGACSGAASQFSFLLKLLEQEHERELSNAKAHLTSKVETIQKDLTTFKGARAEIIDQFGSHLEPVSETQIELDCSTNLTFAKPKPASTLARDMGALFPDGLSSQNQKVANGQFASQGSKSTVGVQFSEGPIVVAQGSSPPVHKQVTLRESSFKEKASFDKKGSFKTGSAQSSNRQFLTRPSMESHFSMKYAAEQHHEYRLLPLWDDILNDKSQAMKTKTGNLSEAERLAKSSRFEMEDPSNECEPTRASFRHGEQKRSSGPCLSLISHPSSSKRLAWDVFALVLVGYDVIVIPLQVFDFEDNIFLSTMLMISMIFWSLDLIGAFFVGYHERGYVVMDLKKIVCRYATTWLCLDCLVVGADWTSFIRIHFSSSSDAQLTAGSYLRVTKFARFLRAARLMRLVKLKRIINEIHDRIDSESLSTYFQVLSSILCILAVNHVVACLWYGLSTLDFYEGPGGTKSWVKEVQAEDSSKGYLYATSLHWSLTQFTPASMEVQPTNVAERWFTVVTVLFGLVMFSSFISGLTSAMASLRKMKHDEHRQYWLLRRYLKAAGIRKRLSLRIQRYLEFVQHAQTKVLRPEDVQILQLLSAPLQNELRFAVNTQHLSTLPLFKYLGQFLYSFPQEYQRVMLKVCNNVLETAPFAKQDTIFFSGEVSEQLFVNARGRLTYRRQAQCDEDDEQVEEGRWICEHVLWVQWVHLGELQAYDDCELLSMNPHKFALNLKSVPIVSKKAANFGKRFVSDLNQTEEDNLSDIDTVFFHYERLLTRKNNFRKSKTPSNEDLSRDVTKSFDLRTIVANLIS